MSKDNYRHLLPIISPFFSPFIAVWVPLLSTPVSLLAANFPGSEAQLE